MALTRVDISLVSASGVVQTPKQDTEPAISGITTEIWFSAGFFRDIVKDLGHPQYYETLYTACCRALPLINYFYIFFYTQKRLCVRNAFDEKKKKKQYSANVHILNRR